MLDRTKERGFTLVELMVVVAIIGILAAVAIPAFMDYMKKSKKTEAALQLRNIAEKCKDYQMSKLDYPPSSTSALPGADGGACPSKFAILPASSWNTDSAWAAIDFHIDEEALFTYHFTHSSTTAANATAVGDLDCDTTKITYSLDLKTTEGNVQSKIYAPDEWATPQKD